MWRYFAHRLEIHSEFDLKLPPAREHGVLDKKLWITSCEKPHPGDLVWQSQTKFQDGVSCLRLYFDASFPLFELPDTAWFRLKPDRIEIFPIIQENLAQHILSRMLGLWMTWQGYTILHGSSVLIGNTTVGFLGHSGAGKSTLSAAMEQDGSPMLTDDFIPLCRDQETPRVAPGLGTRRLWPDSGRYFHRDFEDQELVDHRLDKRILHQNPNHRPGPEQSFPLTMLFVLEGPSPRRHPAELKLLSPAKALTEVYATDFNIGPLQPLSLLGPTLAFLSKLVEKIPVYSLGLNQDLNDLPHACQIIKETVTRQAPPSSC